MAKKANTNAIKVDLMSDHVPYEIYMLRATHDALRAGMTAPGTCRNAFIKSFAVHARALIRFFNDQDAAKAKDFTQGYKAFANGKAPSDDLVTKLNAQVLHIGHHRFNTVEEKLNGADIAKLREAIDAEVSRFVDHLRPGYRGKWDTKYHHLRPWSG